MFYVYCCTIVADKKILDNNSSKLIMADTFHFSRVKKKIFENILPAFCVQFHSSTSTLNHTHQTFIIQHYWEHFLGYYMTQWKTTWLACTKFKNQCLSTKHKKWMLFEKEKGKRKKSLIWLMILKLLFQCSTGMLLDQITSEILVNTSLVYVPWLILVFYPNKFIMY